MTLRSNQGSEKGGSELLQNKLAEVSSDLNKIENDLSEFKPSMNELNRFLGGNTSTGKLGEWNLESIVRDVLPANTYEFQAQINPETTEKADCAITNSEGLIIPIDSKFYQGQYQNYHEAGSKTERNKVLQSLKRTILSDAESISEKYILRNSTSNYVVLYIASEKIIDLVTQIDNLRQECLTDKNTLILGPNALAGFLDTVRLGHYAIKMNENAKKVANTVNILNEEFKKFDNTTVKAVRNLNQAIGHVEDIQTRVNVLGKELKKADESFDENLE
jgi:DNA recombination protein RmuC